MRILLIHPKLENSFFDDIKLPPLGLAYIAGALRESGHDVRILDAILSRDQISDVANAITAYRPHIVGISATSSLVRISGRIARMAKELDPNTVTVLGGVHPTLFPLETMNDPHIDYVIAGEGERSMLGLTSAIAAGEEPAGVRGVVYRRNGEIIMNDPVIPVDDLDELPFPSYDLMPIRKYRSLQISAAPFVTMMTSRGCPYQCIFCNARTIMGGKYRFNSPERIVSEMRYLIERFGIKEILFKDSDFTFDRERVGQICDLILKEGMRVKWSCNGRIGRLGLDLLKKMREAGCRLIEYGIESGDQNILGVLNKKIDIEQVRESFRITRKAGLKTIANFMIGNPGETRESIDATLRIAKEIRPDYCDFSFVTPFPGTKLYDMARQNNWLLDTYDPANIRLDQCTMNATDMSTGELKRMFKKVYRSFYLRPGYILGRMFQLSPYEWKMNILGMLRIIGVLRIIELMRSRS